jgi:uncharacterized membrane protein YdcZ (DUF606 family)
MYRSMRSSCTESDGEPAGLFGPTVQDLGLLKVLGVVLILIGGVLVVRF